jgi:hypothetical protein
MSSKYEPLKKHLTASNTTVVSMTFADVEEILGTSTSLPPASRAHQAWWANGGHRHSEAWTSTGRKASVDLRAQTVKFVRQGDRSVIERPPEPTGDVSFRNQLGSVSHRRHRASQGGHGGEINSDRLLAAQHRYLDDSYASFLAFGGPCVYFHQECLKAGVQAFLSDRHVELVYATLTAWGMHRLGDPDKTKTKLTDWTVFRESIVSAGHALDHLRTKGMLDVSADEYDRVLHAMRPTYRSFRISTSDATIVANSKALFHLLPNLIPPIDRQYTIRFFRQRPELWKRNGKFAMITLPTGLDAQFDLFLSTCISIRRLAARIERPLLDRESREHGVSVPKTIDNAIVNYVRIESKGRIGPE